MTKSLGDVPKSRNRTAGPCSHVDRQYSEWAGCPICGVRELNFGEEKATSSNELTCGGPMAKKDKPYSTLLTEAEKRKPKRRGNNPYGARGKLRCIHCQESRRKVHDGGDYIDGSASILLSRRLVCDVRNNHLYAARNYIFETDVPTRIHQTQDPPTRIPRVHLP